MRDQRMDRRRGTRSRLEGEIHEFHGGGDDVIGAGWSDG